MPHWCLLVVFPTILGETFETQLILLKTITGNSISLLSCKRDSKQYNVPQRLNMMFFTLDDPLCIASEIVSHLHLCGVEQNMSIIVLMAPLSVFKNPLPPLKKKKNKIPAGTST